MKPEQFLDSAPGRLLRVGRGEAVYWAFAPNPLPPVLEYDTGLTRLLEDAERVLGELATRTASVADLYLFTGLFVRTEAIHSSRIEGVLADLRDLFAYEAGLLPLPDYLQAGPEDDLRRVHNCVQAMEYGPERIGTLPLSLRLIRELHEVLMEGESYERTTPGEFRASQNWIGEPGALLADARYVPPPPHEMHTALDAFEKYLHAEDANSPLARLALIHYQLEAIHPFLDGNGRIGRILISLLLEHWKLLPAPLLSLSAYFDLYCHRYYDLLLDVSEREDWREWITFFLSAVSWQARDALDRLGDLRDLRETWHNQARQAGIDTTVVDLLFRQPVLASVQVEAGLDMTTEEANRLLRLLADLDMVEQIGGYERPDLHMALPILTIMGW